VLLVARQNGKSTFLQLLALFFMYVRGVALVIGTAQNLDIAEEVWQGAVDIAEDVPDLAAEIERVNKTNGKKSLELRAGERYKVQAANRRGGRGLSGDLVLMDELREHQSWDAWGAVTKTTLARRWPRSGRRRTRATRRRSSCATCVVPRMSRWVTRTACRMSWTSHRRIRTLHPTSRTTTRSGSSSGRRSRVRPG
jgi:hypothetical protein